MSGRVSSPRDPQTTSRGVRVGSEHVFPPLSLSLTLSLSNPLRALSQPEETDRHVLPAAVDSGPVAQKEQIPVQGAEEGEAVERVLFPCCQLFPKPHPGHKLLRVNESLVRGQTDSAGLFLDSSDSVQEDQHVMLDSLCRENLESAKTSFQFQF